MTDKVISIGKTADGAMAVRPPQSEQLADAIRNLDSLRDALLDGRIKAFIAVGVSNDHSTFAWAGKSAPFSVLEAQGAWAALQGMLPEVL